MGFNMWDGPTTPPGKTKVIRPKSIDELLDEGLSFKDINRIMRLKETIEKIGKEVRK